MNQLRMFDRAIYPGKSKAYQDTCNLLRVLARFEKKKGFTAYEIADMNGYSARHINRIMLQMFNDGLADFKAVERRGKPAREWFAK